MYLSRFAPLANNVVASQKVVGEASGTCTTAKASLVGAQLAKQRVQAVEDVVIKARRRKAAEDAAEQLLAMPRSELAALMRNKLEQRREQCALERLAREEAERARLEKKRAAEQGPSTKRPEWYDVERVLRGNASMIMGLYLVQMQRFTPSKRGASEEDVSSHLAMNLATLLPLATREPTPPSTPPLPRQ